MSRLRASIILINCLGLVFVQGAETWRPGLVSAVVPVGVVWLSSLLLVGIAFTVGSHDADTSKEPPKVKPN